MKSNLLEAKIGYQFRNKALLKESLTHGSYIKEGKGVETQNERLEFLGDAFLDAIVGAQLYLLMPKAPEGILSKTRAEVVCEHSLADVARTIDLGEYILLGHGEEMAGGRGKPSILADALEAVIGAVYLDGGYETAKRLVLNLFEGNIDLAISGKLVSDYKSKVQEILQAGGNPIQIVYKTDREEGPDHDKTFFVHMECDGKVLGSGDGKTKKEAEQKAAKESIEILERRK